MQQLDKSPKRIQSLFDSIAPTYDWLNHIMSFGFDRSWRRCTVRRLQPQVDGPILDLCTGTADFAIEFAKCNPKHKVVGLDFSANMLELGRKRIEKAKLVSQIELVEGDALNLPFDDNSFSVVSVSYGLRNMADTMRGLREMTRVCKPGGTVSIIEFRMPERGWFAPIYRLYFRYVMPRLGAFLTGESIGAYRYLFESVAAFPQGEALADMMREASLSQIEQHPMTFGTVALNTGVKHEERQARVAGVNGA